MKGPANMTSTARPKGRGIKSNGASAHSLARHPHPTRNDALHILGTAAASTAVRCASRRTFAAWQFPNGRPISSARVIRARGGRAPLSTASSRLNFPALAIKPTAPRSKRAHIHPKFKPRPSLYSQNIFLQLLVTMPSARLFQPLPPGYIPPYSDCLTSDSFSRLLPLNFPPSVFTLVYPWFNFRQNKKLPNEPISPVRGNHNPFLLSAARIWLSRWGCYILTSSPRVLIWRRTWEVCS